MSSTSKRRNVENNDRPPESAFAVLGDLKRQAVQDHLISAKQGRTSSPERSLSRRTLREKKPNICEAAAPENQQFVAEALTVVQLTTVRPSQIKKCSKTSLKVVLAPGDRLVALGQYDLSVEKGCIKILGASLHASSKRYHVDAPSTHCLPVIRCDAMELEAAEISLSQSRSGLEQLNQVSPLFRKIWSDPVGSSDVENGDNTMESGQQRLDMGSFCILYITVHKNLLRPLISPPEWNALLSTLQNSESQRPDKKPPIVLVCGPKSAGKSTFSKLLINRIITSTGPVKQTSSQKYNNHGVVVLDCDPGQPEYSPPGQLTLNILKEPNLGPPFSHPTSSGSLIRAHSIAAVTPSNDPELYMSCVLDLLAYYSKQYSNHSLVINAPGWILGTGLEILVGLIQKLHPTAVVYMSQEGPKEVVDSLMEAAKSTFLYTLPSQGSEFAARDSSGLRAMQTMSYFHLQNTAKDDLSWNPTPLSSLPPIQIRYIGKSAGILGILSLGDQPHPDLVAEAINGSVLAIVVIDDLAAIPNYNPNKMLETADPDSIVVRTPKEQIPYFNPGKSVTLDPQYSHTIGCLLVRGIDVKSHRLQVLTPVAPQIFKDIKEAGKMVVLVHGKLENPGWAYTEELYRRSWLEKQSVEETGPSKDGGVEFVNAPWVEVLHDGKGRGEGWKVWKVRRDLGRKGAEV